MGAMAVMQLASSLAPREIFLRQLIAASVLVYDLYSLGSILYARSKRRYGPAGTQDRWYHGNSGLIITALEAVGMSYILGITL